MASGKLPFSEIAKPLPGGLKAPLGERVKGALQQLTSVAESAKIAETVERSIAKAKQKKTSADAIKAGVKPGIIKESTGQLTVVLPDSFTTKEDYPLGVATVSLALSLGYGLKLISYPKPLKAASEDLFQWGVLLGTTDTKVKLNVRSVQDRLELGRIFVRAQQVLHLFGKCSNLDPKILKKDNLFFGNNPGEIVLVDKRPYPIHPLSKTLDGYWQEEEWRVELTNLLVKMLKKSSRLLEPEVKEHIVHDNVMSFQQYVREYMTRDIVLEPAQGKRPAKIQKKIPAMPNLSKVLTKEENEFIRTVLAPSFKDPDFVKDHKAWVNQIMQREFCQISATLDHIYGRRAQLLGLLGQITTKRLQAIRKVVPEAANKRKRDIKIEDLTSLGCQTNLRKDFLGLVVAIDKDALFFRSLERLQENDRLPDKQVIESTLSKALPEPVKQAEVSVSRIFADLIEKEKKSGEVSLTEGLKAYQLNLRDLHPTIMKQLSYIAEKPENFLKSYHFGMKEEEYTLLPTTVKRYAGEFWRYQDDESYDSFVGEIRKLAALLNNLSERYSDQLRNALDRLRKESPGEIAPRDRYNAVSDPASFRKLPPPKRGGETST